MKEKCLAVKIFLVNILVCVIAILITSVAIAQPIHWAIATSSSGSSPYTLGVSLANLINKHQNVVELSAQVTAGFNENLILVAEGDVPIGMTTAYAIYRAYTQQDIFADIPEVKDLRRLFLYNIEHTHIFVRADSDIYTFRDLKGKRFNMNVPATITSIRNKCLLQAFDMTEDDIKVFEISTGGTFNALRDNVIDGSSNGFAIGNASLLELSNDIPIRLLEVPEEEFKKFNNCMANNNGYGVIPGGTYKGQDEDVKTPTGYCMLFTNKNTDEEIIYQITKAFWENLEELQSIDQQFSMLDIREPIGGNEIVPLHPGVERYLKEIGVIN
jgi:hypothetical protein